MLRTISSLPDENNVYYQVVCCILYTIKAIVQNLLVMSPKFVTEL